MTIPQVRANWMAGNDILHRFSLLTKNFLIQLFDLDLNAKKSLETNIFSSETFAP